VPSSVITGVRGSFHYKSARRDPLSCYLRLREAELSLGHRSAESVLGAGCVEPSGVDSAGEALSLQRELVLDVHSRGSHGGLVIPRPLCRHVLVQEHHGGGLRFV
jgi:hypothetical protein